MIKINSICLLLISQGHNAEDPATKTNYGYCATPDKSCSYNTPFTSIPYDKLQKSFDRRDNFQYYRNTGVINARINAFPKEQLYPNPANNDHYGILSESVVQKVFAHEIGHSFGAKHDDDEVICNPSRITNFLMTGQSKVDYSCF